MDNTEQEQWKGLFMLDVGMASTKAKSDVKEGDSYSIAVFCLPRKEERTEQEINKNKE